MIRSCCACHVTCVGVGVQRCYGISVIPEGDFFCDRCKYLRFSSSSAEVVCCLCPIADGAFKQTIDRRWVRDLFASHEWHLLSM
jgi:hypothetical protein